MPEISETWADLIDQFETHLINLNRKPRTQELRRTYMEKFARGRTNSPADVLPRDISKFVGRADWSSGTRQVAADTMRGFFRWARKHNIVTEDPTADLARPRVIHKKATAATRKQINDAIKDAEPRDRLMLELNADAGLSAIEIAQVRRRDLKKINGEYTLRVFGKADVEQSLVLPRSVGERIEASATEYVFPGRRGIGHLDSAYIVRRISDALPPGLTSESVRLGRRTVATASGSWREMRPFHDPSNLDFFAALDPADSEELERYIGRISRDIDRDPAAAIGACKELLESLFKGVLDAKGVEQSQGPRFETFGELFTKASDALDLRASVPGNEAASGALVTAMKGLAQVVEGVGNMRNKIGTGHGHGESPATPAHAHLVFNATVTIAEFVAAIWHAQSK
jgi:integrase